MSPASLKFRPYSSDLSYFMNNSHYPAVIFNNQPSLSLKLFGQINAIDICIIPSTQSQSHGVIQKCQNIIIFRGLE